jgi:hypothetical protein
MGGRRTREPLRKMSYTQKIIRANIIPVVKVTITTLFSTYHRNVFSKIMIEGQVMDRTNSPVSVQGQQRQF